MPEEQKQKTRLVEVNIEFYKSFHIEVPEGVSDEEILESDLVQDEARGGGCCEVEIEHDTTSVDDEGYKSPQDIERYRRHGKVFSWDECKFQ